MKLKNAILIPVAISVFSVGTPANAATTILFDFVGGDRSFNFSLEQGQTPDASQLFAGASQITYRNVSGSFNGTAGSSNTATSISFGNSFFSKLGLNATNFGFGSFGGPVLFDGSRTNPIFNLGTYNLTQAVTTPGTGGGIPEPATWAFMIFGFGAIGGAMRRQRRAKVKVSYA